MKTKLAIDLGLLAYVLCVPAFAQGTVFTYQGRLTDNGASFTGSAEFQPTLWDATTSGGEIAANSLRSSLSRSLNGLFTLPLDFGANFPGANRNNQFVPLSFVPSILAY